MWLAVDFTYSSDSQGTPQPEAGVSPCQRNSAHTVIIKLIHIWVSFLSVQPVVETVL